MLWMDAIRRQLPRTTPARYVPTKDSILRPIWSRLMACGPSNLNLCVPLRPLRLNRCLSFFLLLGP